MRRQRLIEHVAAQPGPNAFMCCPLTVRLETALTAWPPGGSAAHTVVGRQGAWVGELAAPCDCAQAEPEPVLTHVSARACLQLCPVA